MIQIIDFIANFARNMGLILRYETQRTTGLLLTYLKLKLKYVLFTRILKIPITSEHIFGFAVRFLAYKTFIFMSEEIFVNKVYQFELRTKNPLIIDCGSNVGVALFFFKIAYPGCRIIAFEPDEEIFEILDKNVELNKLNDVTLVNKALYGSNAGVTLYYDPDHLASLTASVKVKRQGMRLRNVDSVLLSHFITEPVDFVKMDIEGAEDSVIEDLSKSGRIKLVKEMCIEYHHHITPEEDRFSELLKILEANNFTYQISAFFRQPFIVQVFQDILIYAHNKSYDEIVHKVERILPDIAVK